MNQLPLSRSFRFVVAAVLGAGLPFRAPADTGVDVVLEGAAGTGAGIKAGSALHALALVHAAWGRPDQSPDLWIYRGYVSALALTGRGPTERFLGDVLAASNIEGASGLRLYSWWLESGRRNWTLRGGLLLADEEFAGTDAGGSFCNSAFGWPAFISANTINTGPAFYVPAPGLRLEYRWNDRAVGRVGVYDGDSFDSDTGDPALTRHGLHYQVGGRQGWFVLTEVQFTPGGPTRYKAGAWLHTATVADVRDDDTGQPFALSGRDPRAHGANHGAYFALERTLAGRPGEAGNIEFFVRAGLAPADRNPLAGAFDTGLTLTGIVPARPADVLALGVAHARFSPRYSAHARLTDPAAPAPDFEQVFEASYTLTFSERLSLQPDLQYVRHPGGSPARREALVGLLRLNASF